MKRDQQGMTLIELLISLVLGLSLIAGISSLFLQMQRNNQTQRALSYMMEDGRYALEIMQKELRYAGGLRSKQSSTGSADQIFVALNPLVANLMGAAAPFGFAMGEYVQGDTTAAPANDSVMIRYQLIDANDLKPGSGGNSSSPCTQNVSLDAGEDPATSVHVVTVYFTVTNNNLTCIAQRSTIAAGVVTCVKNCTLTDTPAELINNVAKLAISYGVDSDPTVNKAANYYVNAATVPAASWKQVQSARVSLVLRSTETNLVQGTAVDYKIDGTSVTPTDNRLYRTFSTTLAFRNQL